MKIGVISDTHGMVDRTRQAVKVFEEHGVDTVLHCGDVGSLEVLEVFVGKRLWFVWGNTDRPSPSWRAALETWGFAWPEGGPVSLRVEGRRVLLAHGHEAGFRQVIRGPDADFLFYGHSHSRLCVRIGECVVVNPGAIHRTSQPSVAVVDWRTREVGFLDLAGQQVGEE